jgi:hypothetical protein
LPISVDPVKVSLRTIGFEVSSSPMAPVRPATMLITPAGMPARTPSSAMAKADSGVDVAGLQTVVHPAANAAPTLRASMALGKFHGVMHATTPTGCLMTTIRRSAAGGGITSP